MRLTAHQPAYIPWLGLLAKIADADLFCFFDVVPMESSGFENRQRIKTAQGPQWLTVPVRRNPTIQPRSNVPLARYWRLVDVRIATDQPWARKHWRTVELAYHKAPFFERYGPGFYAVLGMPNDNLFIEREGLAGLDLDMLFWLVKCFGITTPIVRASDYRFQGAKSALVLDMCQQLGASEYVFGACGREYADVQAFEAAGIKVEFQDYRHPEYPQLHGTFLPKMGAVDLLFNVGGQRGLEILMGRG